MNEYPKASIIVTEIGLGSGRVAGYRMTSDEYIKLRQENALGLNNAFLPDEEGAARWVRRSVNKYRGFRIDPSRIIPLPGLSTTSYPGRWRDFELAVCEAMGAQHLGFEVTGHKGYVPDAMLFGIIAMEFKSDHGMYRRGQVKKTR